MVAALYNGSLVSGGVVVSSGAATLTGCTISGNSAKYGGGVDNSASATLTNCTVTGNSASIVGGGIDEIVGTITLTGSTISNNYGDYNGGGVDVAESGTATLTNCTISGNSSELGGGILAYNGTANLYNCTLSGNTATYGGGGLYNYGGSVTLTNTIVAGNNTDIGGATPDSGSNNLIGTGGSGGLVNGVNGNIVGVAQCAARSPWATTAGPTQTMPLLPGSPAINAGTSGAGIPTTDQRGDSRVGAVDIGSFESQGFTVTVVAGSTPQSTKIGTQFGPLAVTVTANNPIEPVNGGAVNFVAIPAANGASAIFLTTTAVISGGTASVTAAPDNVVGSYSVVASVSSTATATLNLTNTGTPLSRT